MDKKFFNYDNEVWRFMAKAGYMMILNLLFLLFSIPLFTAGASLCALYYSIFKMIEGEETGFVKIFLKGFRENFVKGTVIWITSVIIGRLLFLEFKFLVMLPVELGSAGKAALWCLFAFGFVIFSLIFINIFPLQARFYNKLGNTVINAFVSGMKYLPRSLLIIAVDAGLLIGSVKALVSVPFMGVVFFILVFSLVCMVNSMMMSKTLMLKKDKGDEQQ